MLLGDSFEDPIQDRKRRYGLQSSTVESKYSKGHGGYGRIRHGVFGN